MKEVDPHPPSLCMANELLAFVRSLRPFFWLGSIVAVVVMFGARLPTRGADRESHKETLNVILEGEGRYHKKNPSLGSSSESLLD